MKRWRNFFLRLAACGVIFSLLLVCVGLLTRSDMTARPRAYSPEELAAIAASRTPKIDPRHPLVLYRQADYSAGTSAAWYPKGESPVLSALVKEGKLPPVAERVGGEPVVVEGVEGVGRYGGTWMKVASSMADLTTMVYRMNHTSLVRWSPQGYPIVPHVARRYEISADNREFTFFLRRGMKWSDGHPFTADDIMYWWLHEANDTSVSSAVPEFMRVGGTVGKVVKVNDYCVKFVFPWPYGIFLARLAMIQGSGIVSAPAHYRSRFHPSRGDEETINRLMRSYGLASKRSVYGHMCSSLNPEHPRLWPWVYRTHKATPPQALVRNPYYFMVDAAGNQLPYVDRILFDIRAGRMIGVAAAGGEITMQRRHLDYAEYTHLMSRRHEGGYELIHWYPADRSSYVVIPNLNRRIDPARPETRHKHELLNDKRFRQALSLAIDRREIIDAEYNGQGEPAQSAPGPASPFYHQALYTSFVAHDPVRANRVLDDIGLNRRDYEGYRTFKDGSRMLFYLNYCNFTGPGPAQFLVDHWRKIGVRVIPRERSKQLFHTESTAQKNDLEVWIGNGEFFPILEPRYMVPLANSVFARCFGRWYQRGGLYDDPRARERGGIEPPRGHPLRRAMEVYERVKAESDLAEQRRLFREILDIAAENVWTISIATPPPHLVVVKNGLRNVPRDVVSAYVFQNPTNAGVETYYFEQPRDSAGAIAEIKRSIEEATLRPGAPAVGRGEAARGSVWVTALKLLTAAGLALGLLWVAFRYPYIGRRLLIMVPTLWAISVIVFVIIQLPPGDYVTTRIMQLEESGEGERAQQAIEELTEMFHLDEPMLLRYARWSGLYWFTTFDAKDAGLLQGNMGRSMANSQLVNNLIGDRILLTFLISLGTILFTWVVALPIGIYSAVRQYSIGDYVLTFVGFVGMCVPGFLLALVLMTLGGMSGLFSPEYAAQPEWTWGKVADLLRHIWVPITVMGVTGTAGMIRVMRGNLLDELKKPYVVTARAKGVRPLKLLFKYPVRLALNPFISGIGGIFPRLVSGGAVVAMVLSLPTVGPLMLSALMSEDMYLAGSQLMVLSMLGVLGVLVSDLLLLALDPRIRFKGGRR